MTLLVDDRRNEIDAVEQIGQNPNNNGATGNIEEHLIRRIR